MGVAQKKTHNGKIKMPKSGSCCMPNTYTQIYVHIVFAVKYRQSLIHDSWETDLYKYINGIITNKGQICIAINGMPDHIHILIIMKPTCCLSDLVREIKKASTEFIKENKWSKAKFQWQEGFGAFSYHQSLLATVTRYIKNQKVHHAKKTFKKEYHQILADYDLEFNPAYLFDWILEK